MKWNRLKTDEEIMFLFEDLVNTGDSQDAPLLWSVQQVDKQPTEMNFENATL